MTKFCRSLISVLCVFCGLLAASSLGAQAMDHTRMVAAEQAAASPPPSQAAFATIADIVKKLKADPTTDWSKVNLEALRQHLIDMDNVVMRAAVVAKNVEGGLSMDITGTGNVVGGITRMITMHAVALTDEGVYVAKSSAIEGGVRLVVTAKVPSDAKVVAMVRGLGFSGLLTEGDHHAAHHLALARGEPMMHQHKP